MLALRFCNKIHTLKILPRKARSSQILHDRHAAVEGNGHLCNMIYSVQFAAVSVQYSANVFLYMSDFRKTIDYDVILQVTQLCWHCVSAIK